MTNDCPDPQAGRPASAQSDRPVAPPPRSLPRHSDRRNRRWVFGLQEGLQLLWWWIAGR